MNKIQWQKLEPDEFMNAEDWWFTNKDNPNSGNLAAGAPIDESSVGRKPSYFDDINYSCWRPKLKVEQGRLLNTLTKL